MSHLHPLAHKATVSLRTRPNVRVQAPVGLLTYTPPLEPDTSLTAVVEVYQSWCGPCKAVQSTFKRIFFDLSDRPLKFYSVRRRSCGGSHEPLNPSRPTYECMTA